MTKTVIRRVPINIIQELLKKDLTSVEKSIIISILKAQKYYPQITNKMYNSYLQIKEKYTYENNKEE